MLQTLAAFINEAGLPVDTGSKDGEVTIEQILSEKKTFDMSLNFEKLGVDDKDREWQSMGMFQANTASRLLRFTDNNSSDQSTGCHFFTT